jgi:hypothetical protein
MKPETVIIDTDPVRWDDGLQDRFRLVIEPDGSERLQVAVKWFKGWQNGIEWRDVPKVQA